MTWEVESPEGVVLEIEGEEPPTGEQIRRMFAAFAPASEEPQLRAARGLVSAMPTESIEELPAPAGQLTKPHLRRRQVAGLLVARRGAGQREEGNVAQPGLAGRHHARGRSEAIRRPRLHHDSGCR